MGSDSSGIPDREVIERAMPAVVQIVALRQQFLGNLSPAWTGSGTIVDPSGLILTNCHVVNPRAMGMPAPPADRLAVAITQRSDEPPALTYFAEIVVQSPALDLAVLRMAYLIERDFAEFYEMAADRTEDETAKRSLTMLGKWERQHEKLFKRMHDLALEQYASMPWGG